MAMVMVTVTAMVMEKERRKILNRIATGNIVRGGRKCSEVRNSQTNPLVHLKKGAVLLGLHLFIYNFAIEYRY
jgi:hypothetical protein